jgi:hypothetical protein
MNAGSGRFTPIFKLSASNPDLIPKVTDRIGTVVRINRDQPQHGVHALAEFTLFQVG